MCAAKQDTDNEFTRIARYFGPLAKDFSGALDLKDDAALLVCPPDNELVVTTDALVEGIHFQISDPPETIAARLLRRNVSDLAAMGASPYAYTLNTILPEGVGEDWLAAFTRQLQEDQQNYKIVLAGGDSSRSPSGINLVMTAFGHVPKGRALHRKINTGLADDATYGVYVTGTIGDSYLGLQILQGKLQGNDPQRQTLVARHYYPTPRVELAQQLHGLALAAVDISDGLVADVEHMAVASSLAIALELEVIPLSPAAAEIIREYPNMLAELATGGEDYELAFLANDKNADKLLVAARNCGVPLTRVGDAQKAASGGAKLRDAAGGEVLLNRKGWMHF